MIPLFQNSLEARNFGAKASPLQIEELFRSRHSALTKCMSIGGNENLERFTKAAMHAQYCNEAMEEYKREKIKTEKKQRRSRIINAINAARQRGKEAEEEQKKKMNILEKGLEDVDEQLSLSKDKEEIRRLTKAKAELQAEIEKQKYAY